LWGGTYWHPGGASTPLRFPGQYADDETGLHYNNQRYYDPATGRYLSGDPLGLIPGPNPDAYVHNPHTWSDPLGLVPGSCAQPRGRHRAGPGRPSYLSPRHRAGPGRPSYSSPGGLGYGKVPYRPSLSEYARDIMTKAAPDAEASEYAERGGFGASVAELLINISNPGLEMYHGFKIPEIDSETWDQLGQMAGYYGKAVFDFVKRVRGGW
jgi:RHS repeat-associated protein